MALIFVEGFESTQASKFLSKGWTANPSSVIAGRYAGSAIREGSSSTSKSVPAVSALVVGFAFRCSDLTIGQTIFRFVQGSNNLIQLSNDGALHLRVTDQASTVRGTGTAAIVNNVWNYIEFKVLLAGAASTAEVRVNGVVDIPSFTYNFGTGTWTAISLVGSSSNVDFDDLYLLDTSGSAPRNTYLGDVRVATLFPTAPGATTQWTPSTGANWAALDEAATTYPDDDTTYVSDSTPGHIDTYTFADLPAGATAVHGVQVNAYARKDDAGTRTIAPVIRKSSTDYPGTSVSVPSSYAFLSEMFNQDPTAVDWTVANVNAAEFGIKEVA